MCNIYDVWSSQSTQAIEENQDDFIANPKEEEEVDQRFQSPIKISDPKESEQLFSLYDDETQVKERFDTNQLTNQQLNR